MNKNFIIYFVVISIFGLGLWKILDHGKNLEKDQLPKELISTAADQKIPNLNPLGTTHTSEKKINVSVIDSFKSDTLKSLRHPLSLLLLQVIVIITFSRICGIIFRKIRQPMVIGEIVAGIVLGPSLLGLIFPEATAFLFPVESLKNLQLLSQIGLILFMFIIGMELDLKNIKEKTDSAVLVSHASVIFPFFLGALVSIQLYHRFAPPGISFSSFALFIGIAMSITAFPVLARIIQEKGLMKTSLGQIALTCAAVDDITAWCVLAIVVAIVQASAIAMAILTIVLSVFYIAIMIFFIQPLLGRMSSIYISREILGRGVMAAVFVLLFTSAFVTELIGIHALFGAFIAGVIMPTSTKFRKIITDKLEDISMVFLLPLFFVFTGLRTQIGLLNDSSLIGTSILILAVAIIGKFGGSAFAARVTGMSWRNSFALGALMNTRGLMELVILNIGYDLGVLSPVIFSMMVIMALVTTFMTGPAISLINPEIKSFPKPKIFKQKNAEPEFNVLLPFGPVNSGIALLKLVAGLFPPNSNSEITLLHLSPVRDYNFHDDPAKERKFFAPILALANNLKLKVQTLYLTTSDIVKDITKIASDSSSSFLFLGAAKTIFGDSATGGKVSEILKAIDCKAGIFIDQNFQSPASVLVNYYSRSDNALLELAGRYFQNYGSKITILNETGDDSHLKGKIKKYFGKPAKKKKLDLIITTDKLFLNSRTIEENDLTLLSLRYWQEMENLAPAWIQNPPSSILIIKSEKIV
ncbi:MAG: cation:proton antiporter [Leptospira sp.]|nr:cation:proton antiporter [Leptospira sp.]